LGAADNKITSNPLRKCDSVLPLLVRGGAKQGVNSEFSKALSKSTGEPNPGHYEFKNYNDAMTAALMWLKDRGFSGELQNFKVGKLNVSSQQLPNVVEVTDAVSGKIIEIRIEYHPIRDTSQSMLYNGQGRAHINVRMGKEDGPHLLFPGDQRDVDAVLKQLLPTLRK
jgi:hypothetical protein